MLMLPMVCAGEYDSDRPLAVFAELADAEEYARRFNAERGYGLADGERARVESIDVFPAGDPGRSGHNTEVEYVHHYLGNSGWVWRCACGAGEAAGSGSVAREAEARHLAHWMPAAEQSALPA